MLLRETLRSVLAAPEVVGAPSPLQRPAFDDTCAPSPDLGRKLENAVLLALRRKGASPTFAAAPHEWECDFVTADLAIQCCARLSPENRQRELRGLIKAAALPGANRKQRRELLVITLDQEDTLTEEGHHIRIIPAWKWLD